MSPTAVMSPSLNLGHFVNENLRQCWQDEYIYLLFVMLQAHDDPHNMFSLHEPGEEYIVQYLNALTALKLLFCTF